MVKTQRPLAGKASGHAQQRTGDASSAGAVAVADYTQSAPASPYQRPCPRLVVWLRCRVCHAGYFAASAPGPQGCPACMGGRLQPVAVWDLRTEAAPPGMLRRGAV